MSARATKASAPDAPALMIGSHIDTVRDAGRYDGNLGALAALAVVEELAERGERLDVRDRDRRLRRRGGRAVSHDLDRLARLRRAVRALAALEQKDADGVTMREALTDFRRRARRDARRCAGASVAAFVELHIEQGPVLEAEGLAARRRHRDQRRDAASRRPCAGLAGHAGAVPMNLRRDALTGGAEMILRSRRARASRTISSPPSGGSRSSPARSTSFPGEARFTHRHPRARATSAASARSPTSPKRLQRHRQRRNVTLTLGARLTRRAPISATRASSPASPRRSQASVSRSGCCPPAPVTTR